MAFDPIERTSLALSVGAVAASWAFATPAFAASVAAGAALEAFNFRALRRTALGFFHGELAGGRLWNGLFAFRFVLLAVGVGVATRLGADPVGLVVGLSLVLPAAFAEAWRVRPPIDPNAPALDPEDEAWERWNPWLAREGEPSEEEDAA